MHRNTNNQLAEQTERYDEMKENMKEVVKAKKALTKEERNLLSVAYKNVVGARRASWRVLHSFSKSKEEGFDKQRELVDEYRRKVETEIDDICEEILSLLGDILLKNAADDAEASVFYLKMMGDYLRYLVRAIGLFFFFFFFFAFLVLLRASCARKLEWAESHGGLLPVCSLVSRALVFVCRLLFFDHSPDSTSLIDCRLR